MEEEILAARRLGFDWPTIADAVGVSHKTLQRWVREDPEFRASIKRAFARAKMTVASKLVSLAVDGKNPAAMIFWLRTRCPEFFQGREPAQNGKAKKKGPTAVRLVIDSGRSPSERARESSA